MSKADTWMPLYIGDYLADTGHLSAQQHGAYLLLLMHYWRNGPLPDDDAALARIARLDRKTWDRDGAAVREFFAAEDGRLTQKRMDAERARAGHNSDKRRAAGSQGAAAKWGRRDTRDAVATRSERLAAARAIARHTPEEWNDLKDACGNKCVRCGANDVPLVKDHITPIYQGGSDGIDNLQPLCHRCNSSKGPETTDHRPAGWREKTPGKTPGKRQANAGQTPGPSPSPIETTSPPPSAVGVPSVAVPAWLDATAWAEWCAYRRGKRWTPQAAALSIRNLGKLRDAGDDPRAVIEQSIANGWTGLFPLRGAHAAFPKRDDAHARRTAHFDAMARDAGLTRADFGFPTADDLGFLPPRSRLQ